MPPEHEARSRAFYDHEQDEPRGRRRRAVADWGVGEDVFDRMPGPRFSRRGEEPRRREEAPRARFALDDEAARARFVSDEEAPRARFARDDEAPRARFAREDEPMSRTIVIEREPELDAELLADSPRDDAPLLDDAPYAEAPDEYAPRGHVGPNGRRTIVIGGHPDRLPVPRSRRPRTAVERIGPRPDRIVGYAVAMGVLLILIAILTSS